MSAAVHHHPRTVELVARRKLRRQVERAVSRLIAILDELDTDADLEPSLGAAVVLYPVYNDQRFWAEGANDDREHDAGDDRELEDEHGADDDAGEPSLGAAEGRKDQRRWAAGGRQDLEDDEAMP